MTRIYPVILSGGAGTRLWPLSRRDHPKQFLDLGGEGSLFQQTCRRLADPLFAEPVVLGNQQHRFLIAGQMAEIGQAGIIVLEPEARNTAPAAATAALMAARDDPERLVLLMPSDHMIGDATGFTRSVRAGMRAAREGRITTFGVRPEAPETAYGYLETGAQDDGVFEVARFIEKPDRERAQAFLEAGNFYWNAGIFLFSARAMIEAFTAHQPDMLAACREALEGAVRDLDFLRLAAPYAACPDISLDYAVMEKAERVGCVPLATPWTDLGTWPAVWRFAGRDEEGNGTSGEVLLVDTSNSYAHSADGARLILVGLENVMAIATRDAVLVSSLDRAGEAGTVARRAMANGHGEAPDHARTYRPWGWFEGLDRGERFQVKRLMVRPGAQISLQAHQHRAEHWTVVSGTVEVTLDGETFRLSENQSASIPVGARHRLANPGKTPAFLIEVQTGCYLGEDDIIRFEDDYGR